jgi:hypothetical protein
MKCHFSGSTTSRAPAPAARRTSPSATAMFRAVSPPVVICTAPTRRMPPPLTRSATPRGLIEIITR